MDVEVGKQATVDTRADKLHKDRRNGRCKTKDSSSSSKSSLNDLSSTEDSKADSIIIKILKVQKKKRVEAELSVLRRVKKIYAQALDYRMWRHPNRSLK